MTCLFNLASGRPSAARVSWALERSRPVGPAAVRPRFRLFPPRRQRSASEHLYFDVRPLAPGRVQYGFADDRGNIVLSVVGEAPTPGLAEDAAPPEDLAAAPMDGAWLASLVGAVCRGASLVAFHRVLKSGLLPPGALAGAAGLDCAWRRYVRLARRLGRFDRAEPLTLDDALDATGLGAIGAPDAALRALAVRELWTWMDRTEAGL
ncbi:MAG TPA: hypothetical protein VGG29_13425 [Caulobacteraceae bacterium]|jgi:hypothetical protein